MSVGDALVRSKRNYLKTTAAPLSGLDEKALLEATLFGLPMLSVNLQQPAGSPPPTRPTSVARPPSAGTGLLLGLHTADLGVRFPRRPPADPCS